MAGKCAFCWEIGEFHGQEGVNEVAQVLEADLGQDDEINGMKIKG